MRNPYAIAVMMLVCCAGPIHAQSYYEVELVGTVRAVGTGDPVPQAVVTLLTGDGVVHRTTTGGLNGSFRVTGADAGVYDVRVEALGFTPRVYADVRVRPGVSGTLDARLRLAGAPLDTVPAANVGTAASFDRWVDASESTLLPMATPTVGPRASLSTLVSDDLGMEGLPGAFTVLSIDGIRFRPVLVTGVPFQGAGGGLPTANTLSSVQVASHPPRLEMPYGAGGGLVVHSRRGWSADRNVEVAATSSAADPTVDLFADAPDALTFVGGTSVAAVLSPDTTSLVAGADAWQIESPSTGALPSASIGVPGLDLPYLERDRGFSGFLRLDRVLGNGGALWASGRVGYRQDRTDFARLAAGSAAGGERLDLLAGAGLYTDIGRRERIEARVGVTRSEWTSARLSADDLPFDAASLTLVDVASGEAAGPGPMEVGSASELDVQLQGTLHLRRGDHALRVGATGGVSVHSQDWGTGYRGRAFVGAGDPFDTWEGYVDLRQHTGVDEASVPRLGVYVEDTWRIGPGLHVDLGARFDSDWLPLEVPVAAWFVASGLSAPTPEEQVSRGSALLGLRWQSTSGTRFGAHVSYVNGEVDPRLVGEILAGTSFLEYRITDDFSSWPDLRVAPPAPQFARESYSYMIDSPESPSTVRLAATLGQALGPVSLDANAIYRRTENLLRRRDLNQPAAPHAEDRYGRPLWAQPLRIGAWLGPDPATTQRIRAYGAIWELEQGGWSEFIGLGLRLNSESSEGLRWSAEYLWSRTEDNLPGLTRVDRLSGVPLAGPGTEEVTVGTSDLDRPHRLVGTLVLPLPLGEGTALSGVYRYRSGAAFTPGYRSGVDANLDGVDGNDPAFVTSDAVGTHGASWSCLRQDAERFATRNQCRTSGVHDLDLRLTLGLLGGGVRIWAEVFNLLDQREELIDTALHRVDPDAPIEISDGVARLPFEVNPSFGEPLRFLSDGRSMRLGLRIEL